MKTALTALAIAAMTVAPAFAADVVDAQKDAQEFVKKASIANMFEIESSKIALQRAQNADVKAFAQKMIDDHTKTGAEFKTAVSKSGLKLVPNESLDEEHQKKISELKQAETKDFDAKYLDLQEDAHEKAVDLFEDYSEKDDANASLKAFAAKTLPHLKEHEAKVDQLDKTAD